MTEPPYGLLGMKPSRQFKIFRSEWPAIFRFNGELFIETYDIDAMDTKWFPISEEAAGWWLNGGRRDEDNAST